MLEGAAAGIVGLILVIAGIVYVARLCVRRMVAEIGLVESQRFTFPEPGNDKTVLQAGENIDVNFGLKVLDSLHCLTVLIVE